MQDPRDGAKVRPKSCRHDDGFVLIHVVHIPHKWLLYYPAIASGDLAECSVVLRCDCEFLHDYSGVSLFSGSTGTSGVSGTTGTITPSTYPNSLPTESATAWLGIRARQSALYA